MFLTFTTENYALVAQAQIWVNMVRDKSTEGDGLVGLPNDPYTTTQVAALSDSEVESLVIYGYKQGKIDITDGFTTKWADYSKAWELVLWYMAEPDIRFMTSVSNYEEHPFDPNWEEPE